MNAVSNKVTCQNKWTAWKGWSRFDHINILEVPLYINGDYEGMGKDCGGESG